MDRATVLEQLTEVAVDVLGVDPTIVAEASSFKDDLDADSLDLVEVVMALEERFDISIPEDKLDGIETVSQAIDLVIDITDAASAGAGNGAVPAAETEADATSAANSAPGESDAPADSAAATDDVAAERAERSEPAESADRA